MTHTKKNKGNPSTAVFTGRLSLIALAVMGGQFAATNAQAQSFNIPPQSLTGALNDYADAANVQLSYPAQQTTGLRSAGLEGNYSPAQALQKLLAGSGLKAETTANGTITLAEAGGLMTVADTAPEQPAGGEQTMPKVKVEADSENPYDDPNWTTDPRNTDYNRPNATTATKTDTPIMETPVNIQVVPQQVLKDQQTTRIEQALQNTSGIYKQQAESAETFNIRGFQTFDYYRDGVRNQSALTQAGDRETANLERIELLKGPAAILFGRLQPGGMINLVTKKPLEQFYHSLQQQFGSFSQFRTTLDTTGPITDDKELLYRFNLAYENKGSFREFVDNDRIFLAPVIKWNISDRTQATFEMEYKHANERTDFGIPAKGNRPINIPRERNLGEPFTFSESDDVMLGFNWSHEFNDQWKIQHKFNSNFTNEDDDVVIGSGDVPLGSSIFQRFYAGFRDNKTQNYSNNLDLTGHFDTFGLKHTVLFGGDYYLFHNAGLIRGTPSFPSININNPTHINTPPPFDPSFDYFYDTDEEWYGLYAQDQISLPYNVHLLAGFRYDNARVRTTDNFGGNFFREDDDINPRVGLLWQPIKEVSLYGNYVENFGVPNNFSSGVGGAALGPETAQQWEAGVKTELFGGRLTGSLAWYQLTKQNIVTGGTDLSGQLSDLDELAGEAVNEGIELDIAGEILPGWNVIGAYSFIDSEITNDPVKIYNRGVLIRTENGNGGNRLPNVPEHGGSIWSTYQLQSGALQGLKFGAGAVARSQQQGNSANDFQLPGYVLMNVMASYEFKVGKTKISTQLNVDNLLDKNYFPTSNGFGRNRIDVGSPRTFLGSVKIEY